MKLHLNATLRAALIAAIIAVGMVMPQTLAESKALTVIPTEKTGANVNITWTGGDTTLNSWELTFDLKVTDGTANDFFNISSHNGTAQVGWALGVNGTSLRLAQNGRDGSPVITLADAYTVGTAQPVTFQFVRDVDQEGLSLGTGTFTVTANGQSGIYEVDSLTDTALVSNSKGHIWCNGFPEGKEQLTNITLTQLDDHVVTVPTSTWQGTEGSHNWADSVWDTGSYPDGSKAVFDATAEYSLVTISEATTVATVSVSGQEYTFEILDGGSLTAAKANIADGAGLTIVGGGTATITELSGVGDLTVGEAGIATVNGLSSYTGVLGVADGGTLNLGSNATVSNLTVERGTVTTTHSSGSSVVTNTLTIGADGTFKVMGDGVAFGYGVYAKTNIVMQGTEGHLATLALEQATIVGVPMTTNIAMHGYSAITVKDGARGFYTYGGNSNITVDGVENSIAVIGLRDNVTIDVAAEGELSVGKFTQYGTSMGAVTKTGEGIMTIIDASTLPGLLNINEGEVSIEADTTLAGLSLNASGTLELTTGANMHIGSIVSMGADQSADAMISGALEVANDNMHGVGGKGLLKNTCMETSDNYTIEDMSISGSLIDVGEGTTLYLVNVDIKSDTHITDEAAWLDMKATKGWLDKDNTQVVREYTTEQDTTLFKSGDTQRSITLAVGSEIVELTSDMFDTVTMTGTDLWLDMTGIAEATYNKDYFTLEFKNLAHSLENAQVDVENLHVYATLDGERYTEAYSTANGGLTTTLYFSVPEPTTSTLSLLALAALAARRRRK